MSMKTAFLDSELFVKVNNLKEVTNPVILDRGSVPTPDGLLSTEIFGITPKERKETYAYIDLQTYFLHPLVYETLKRQDRRIDSIIAGTKKYIIDKKGDIVEDPNGDTGIDWLYKNWEKIKFKRNSSEIRSERIYMYESNSKKELFIRYFIVEPAYYRDINLQNAGSGKPALHEINVGSDQIPNGSSYSKLLRLVTTLKSSGSFIFALNNTKYQIQICIYDIYTYFKSRIEKKNGIIKRGIMGKSIDFGSRLVMSSSHMNTDNFEDMLVDSTHCGLPLANCISNTIPFFQRWLVSFFRRELEASGSKYPILGKDGKVKYVEPKNPAAHFNDEYCSSLINKFINSFSERFDPIEIPTVEDGIVYMSFKGRQVRAKEAMESGDMGGISDRYMTLTDLMYMAAVDIYKDKHVIITRYPVTSFQSLFPIKVRPLSTQKTCKMQIGIDYYPFYPVIDPKCPKSEVATQFIDILMIQNTYLQGLNGDYDGDVVSIRTVFSQEANLECARMAKEPTNFLSANGTNVRTTTNEGVQTLYMLTRE